MKRPFWIPFIVAMGMIVLLYGVGFIAEVKLFKLIISPAYTEISLVPILIGVAAGFISEWVIRRMNLQ